MTIHSERYEDIQENYAEIRPNFQNALVIPTASSEIDIAGVEILFEGDEKELEGCWMSDEDVDFPGATDNQIPCIEMIPTIFDDEIEPNGQKVTRKRRRNEGLWKQNVRKRLRMSGEKYIDRKGNTHRERLMKSKCNKTCNKNCMTNFPEDGRQRIFKDFWKLNDDKKLLFFSKYLKRIAPARRRINFQDNVGPRKNHTSQFYMELNGSVKQVCKSFFLSTLDVTDRQIGYYFKFYENTTTSIPHSPKRGRYNKSHILLERKSQVMDHINRFPRIRSHYCRTTIKRKYLDPQLTVPTMYKLYKKLPEVTNPVKLSMYRNIFNSEFNLGFHKPKKDQCDQCMEFKAKKNPTQEEIGKHADHIQRKIVSRLERKKDRENKDPTRADIAFDMENVRPVPKSNVGAAFYLRKLNTYNLTARYNKTAYCAIWHEYIIGREIANAMICILKEICKDYPELTHLNLWSDSCVPQNRNSIMSLALADFIGAVDNDVTAIEQKFSEPGHGNIQEVDTAHSIIENHLKSVDIWSPSGLLEELRKLEKRSSDMGLKFKIIEMMDLERMRDYHKTALTMDYSKVPYKKVKHLMYTNDNVLSVKYKLNFGDNFETAKVYKGEHITESNFPTISNVPNEVVGLTEEKLKDISAMIKFMSNEEDIDFYKSLTKKKLSKTKKQKNVTAEENKQETVHGRQSKTTTKKRVPVKKPRGKSVRNLTAEEKQEIVHGGQSKTTTKKRLPSNKPRGKGVRNVTAEEQKQEIVNGGQSKTTAKKRLPSKKPHGKGVRKSK